MDYVVEIVEREYKRRKEYKPKECAMRC